MSMMHGHGEEKQNKAGPPPIQGKLEVTLERNPGGKTMTMGLTAKGCITNVGCIFSSPVFNHTEIPGRSVAAVKGLPHMTSAQKEGGVKNYPKFVDKQYINLADRGGEGQNL